MASTLSRFDARETLTYPELQALMEREAARASADLAAGRAVTDPHDAFLALNLQRMKRIDKTYRVPPELHQAIAALRRPQAWRVLTEPWCGDSAQSVGVLAAIAASASATATIDLRFVLRDQNPELMDRYLTDGNRAIPLLVAFDEHGSELFRWGPRPRPAVELFRLGKAEGLPREELLTRLHRWYALDRGRSVTAEIEELLSLATVPLPAISSCAPLPSDIPRERRQPAALGGRE